MSRENDLQRLVSAQHAMQSGVALEMNWNPQETEPKHLRVGINSAMCEHAALVRLLIEKGVISDEEYVKACADEMEREVERYQERAKTQFGGDTKLTFR